MRRLRRAGGGLVVGAACLVLAACGVSGGNEPTSSAIAGDPTTSSGPATDTSAPAVGHTAERPTLPTTPPPRTPGPHSDPSPTIDPGAHNALIERGPLTPRGGHSVVWTGSEMIVWGGCGDEMCRTRFADGAAYDPDRGTWRRIAEAPLSARQYHLATWTGERMLVFGGQGRSDGAAYDPERDVWGELAPAPFPLEGEPIEGVIGWAWVGDELAVWHTAVDRLAIYSPDEDRWAEFQGITAHADLGDWQSDGYKRAVLRSNGDELYALASGPYPEQIALRGARSDDGGRTWSSIPPGELWTASYLVGADPTLTAWAGDRLLAWSHAAGDARTIAYDLTTHSWVSVDPIPIRPCEGQPGAIELDDRALAFGGCGGPSALYDPRTATWTAVHLDGHGPSRYAVWTGTTVLVWGETCCYGTGGRSFTVRTWRYTPPPRGTG